MPKYISIAQYRLADAGIVGIAAGSGITDLSLARILASAEADIDAYCAFPLYLNGGFEPHMTGLIQEGFDQYNRRLANKAGPVPLRNAQRYRIHISNASPSGIGLFATINPGDVVINQGGGYVEIVPLQAILYSLAPVVWDLGLDPPLIEADFEVGFFEPVFGATLYDDAGTHSSYRALDAFWASLYTQAIANQPNQLPPIPPNVYKNGVLVTATTLTSAITPAGGAITALSVAALPAAIPGSRVLTLTPAGGPGPVATLATPQTVTVGGGGAAAGATSIPISSVTPSIAYPVGSVVADGYGLNWTEGQVLGSSIAGVANTGTDVITADYTTTIPYNVREAAIAQTTWRLALRQVAQAGALPYDLARNMDREVKRKDANAAGVGALCDTALGYLQGYKRIAVA